MWNSKSTAWLTPILATAVAFVVTQCRRGRSRRMLTFAERCSFFFTCRVLRAAMGRIISMGALINKAAPTR